MYKCRISINRAVKVRHPEWGPDAYTLIRDITDFPYGKNHPFKSSKEALKAANALMSEMRLSPYYELLLVNWRGNTGSVIDRLLFEEPVNV